MTRDEREKKQHLSRLQAWKDELKTNKYKMRHLAERAIKVIEDQINERWPGAI